MNYDGTNSNVVLQGFTNPEYITTICFPNEVHKTTLTTNPSTSENSEDLDAATAVTDQGDVTIVQFIHNVCLNKYILSPLKHCKAFLYLIYICCGL